MQRRRRRHAINNKLCAIQNKNKITCKYYKLQKCYICVQRCKEKQHTLKKTKQKITHPYKNTHTHANQQNPIDLFFDAKVPALGPPCSGHVFAGSHPTVTGPELSVRKKKKNKQNQVRERVSNNKKLKRCSIFL